MLRWQSEREGGITTTVFDPPLAIPGMTNWRRTHLGTAGAKPGFLERRWIAKAPLGIRGGRGLWRRGIALHGRARTLGRLPYPAH